MTTSDSEALAALCQFARLAEGRIQAEDFDYGYLRFELGRAGAARLAALEGLEAHARAAERRGC